MCADDLALNFLVEPVHEMSNTAGIRAQLDLPDTSKGIKAPRRKLDEFGDLSQSDEAISDIRDIHICILITISLRQRQNTPKYPSLRGGSEFGDGDSGKRKL